MVTYKIHLIRHGTTQGNVDGRYVGRTDLPICEDGVRQLQQLIDTYTYPKVEQVFTSPLQRCVQTADMLYPDTYTEIIEDFIEFDFGEFEGKTIGELQDNKAYADWMMAPLEFAVPGGENGHLFLERLVTGLSKIFNRMMNEKIFSVALITHGGVIMSLLSAMGIPKRAMAEWIVENGKGYTIQLTTQMWMRDAAFEVFGIVPAPKEEEFDDE